ncbi:small ubiquitin-related modifier 1 [Tanacetum coccineum]
MKPVKSEDKKPFGDQSVHVNLKVKSQDGMEVSFRFKRNKKLQDLLNEYCDKQSKDTTGSEFLLNGNRFQADKTPDESKMNPMKFEEKKPFGDQSVHINLKVKSQDGIELSFRIKRNKQLKTLIDEYCDKQSKETNATVFVFNRKRLQADKTPDELEMEDGEVIDAILYQMGGNANLF